MSEHIKEQLKTINQQVKELAAIYHNAAAVFGISDNEFWVWYALVLLDGDFSQQDICDIWSLPKQTVNSIVSNMVKKGFVQLEAVPGTRNRKVIRITEEGRRYSETNVMQVYHAEQNAFGRMSEEERAGCIALLGNYISLLKEEVNET